MESPEEAGAKAGRAARDAALAACASFEFDTYLCGSVPPPGLPEAEADAWRRACNRALGTALGEAWGLARRPEFLRPDVQVHYRAADGRVLLEPAPLFVYGRYRKLSRTLPQTPFHCRTCHGKRRAAGCVACGGTGRVLPGSVAEFLLPHLREAFRADEAGFHGCGREDADARMLGRGRPFVASLRIPRRRHVDLVAVRAAAERSGAGAVEFPLLVPAGSDATGLLAAAKPAKRYLALCEVEGGVAPEEAGRVAAALAGATLEQRTPERVSARRADLVRPRRVLEASARVAEDGLLALEVRTEAGTYVKELVSGDAGRTTPSVASLLGRPARCVSLDVLEVEFPDLSRDRTEPDPNHQP